MPTKTKLVEDGLSSCPHEGATRPPNKFSVVIESVQLRTPAKKSGSADIPVRDGVRLGGPFRRAQTMCILTHQCPNRNEDLHRQCTRQVCRRAAPYRCHQRSGVPTLNN